MALNGVLFGLKEKIKIAIKEFICNFVFSKINILKIYMYERLMSLVGIIVIFFLVWLLSTNKKKFPIRIVIWGIIIQLILGLIVLKLPIGVEFFRWLGDAVTTFLGFSMSGAKFLFGNAINPEQSSVFGFQFAILVSCTVIFFSSFVSILYHYGILQRVVYGMAWVMSKSMGTSGSESLSASANIFLGQTEAPLLIRHYLGTATQSELFAIMVGGFATIAGGVMAAYISMGINATYLISASIISAPGGLMLAKIVMPPLEKGKSLQEIKDIDIPKHSNVISAVSQGATDGVYLSINIMAMLIAFISIIALFDGGLGLIHNSLNSIGLGFIPSSFREILGYLFTPFGYITGIPASEIHAFSSLLGTKIAVNEFLAYADLSALIKSGVLSHRTILISTFALCGFANISSIAIQIAGIGSLAPNRKSEVARFGLRAMITGGLANLLTASIAGLLF
jgi:CNT family concentrative nucleoside transporter